MPKTSSGRNNELKLRLVSGLAMSKAVIKQVTTATTGKTNSQNPTPLCRLELELFSVRRMMYQAGCDELPRAADQVQHEEGIELSFDAVATFQSTIAQMNLPGQ
jgi:hypothetical protein